jgi:transposase InsO family protein
VHIAIDDCTRLAYAEVLGAEKATTVVAFLRRAVGFFARHGMTVEQLLTDNGSGYRSLVHAIACRALGIRHLRTRAYRPQTNGKAERFIRTMRAPVRCTQPSHREPGLSRTVVTGKARPQGG